MSRETLKERVAQVEEALGEWCIEEDVFVWTRYKINEFHN